MSVADELRKRVGEECDKTKKGFDFIATVKEERSFFHPEPLSTDSCLLSDFHLKPTPVMGNNT